MILLTKMLSLVRILYHVRPINSTPEHILTSGCKTTIENLTNFTESVCAPSTNVLPCYFTGTTVLLRMQGKL